MSESQAQACSQSSVKARIDAFVQKNSNLDEQKNKLREESFELLRKLRRYNEMETAGTEKCQHYRGLEATHEESIEASRILLCKKREEIKEIDGVADRSQRLRTNELLIFENRVAEAVPKFLNALTYYSTDNVTAVIENTKRENQEFQEGIAMVDREVHALMSKYEMKEGIVSAIPSHELELTDLQKLKDAWNKANQSRNSERKRTEHLNKQLQETAKRNDRKMARLLSENA
ncbi:uncharacterized protein LOC124405060 [Diprion similis]|uniref:uncharacterized protein LOC124405060 n=1 Tax=Diprion similis TaxID=362088 RepID=UPI001EF93623|nr:uncharacterized protein LOC124405060 [Diprion similis]